METYKEEYVLTFLKNQEQLFEEPIAETFEEAEAFLEECLAVVVDSLKEVREFMEEEGMDVEGLSDKELEEQSEVFRLPDGKYLIVEGYSSWSVCENCFLQSGGYRWREGSFLHAPGFFYITCQYKPRNIRLFIATYTGIRQK